MNLAKRTPYIQTTVTRVSTFSTSPRLGGANIRDQPELLNLCEGSFKLGIFDGPLVIIWVFP